MNMQIETQLVSEFDERNLTLILRGSECCKLPYLPRRASIIKLRAKYPPSFMICSAAGRVGPATVLPSVFGKGY